MLRKLLVAFTALFLLPVLLLAQDGKLRGRVTDRESGEPLIGANVTVDGTSLGASSDLNGEYIILSVPPGTYTKRPPTSDTHHTLFPTFVSPRTSRRARTMHSQARRSKLKPWRSWLSVLLFRGTRRTPSASPRRKISRTFRSVVRRTSLRSMPVLCNR